MPAISRKVVERLTAGIKTFQPIALDARTRDVLEGEKADSARRKVAKSANVALKETS